MTSQNPVRRRTRSAGALLAGLLAATALHAGAPAGIDVSQWNTPVEPFKIYGNTYYVGTQGIASVLITSDYGHVLIDGGFESTAPLIASNIEKLGFKVEQVKAILQTHAHPDHVAGIAELQKRSGASVYARRPADEVMRTGRLPPEDPQYDKRTRVPTVPTVWVVHGDQLLGVGSNRLRALATPGHTPGGTSWTWDACEGGACLTLVYADSLAPVSSGDYRFSDHPEVVEQFQTAFSTLENQKCEVLITPHPGPEFFTRMTSAGGKADALKDPEACKRYVADARQKLEARLEQEKSAPRRRK